MPVLAAPRDGPAGSFAIVMPFLGTATLDGLIDLAYQDRTSPVVPRRGAIVLEAARCNSRPDDPVPEGMAPDPFLAAATFVDAVVRLGVQMADGLSAVHARGLMHHDLKPSNVLLGLDGRPRLLDFNLASELRESKSRMGGTLPYMPPEQLVVVEADGAIPERPDARGDLFSLGVILYELLCGRHPFGPAAASKSARTAAGTMLVHQRAGAVPLRRHNPRVPRRLAAVVHACLAFDPDGRPDGAAAVAAELRRCYSLGRRARGWVGRPAGRLAAAACVGLAAGGGVYVSQDAFGPGRAHAAELTADDHALAGLADAAAGRYDDARTKLTRALDADGTRRLVAGPRPGVAGPAGLRRRRRGLRPAGRVRPKHGPTLALLAWVEARRQFHERAIDLANQAVEAGYNPAAVYTVRGYSEIQFNLHPAGSADIAAALAADPNYRPALFNRFWLGLTLAMPADACPPAAALDDAERCLKLGPPDVYLLFHAARLYGWATLHAPDADAKAKWTERTRELAKEAVEAGCPPITWQHESIFKRLFGDNFAADWKKPEVKAIPEQRGRLPDPLTDLKG